MKDKEMAKRPKGSKMHKYETKRGSYLEDEAKIRKTPGPGVYKDQNLWPGKATTHTHVSKKLTYID